MRILVGQGSCGLAAGAGKVFNYLQSHITDGNLAVDLDVTGCIGNCYLEPIVEVIEDNGTRTTYVKVDEDSAKKIVEEHIINNRIVEENKIDSVDVEAQNKQIKVALKNCGNIDPENIDEYIGLRGYEAAKRAFQDMTPEDVIEQIKKSGLRGRGGAGFPTWFKWNAALGSKATPKYLVCNADEGDPGAFMDRAVIEGDPHGLIEGMMIGARAMGAEEGIVYVRAEYPLAIKRLTLAIEQAREKGFIGKDIFGLKGVNFEMRIKAGAGAFVCGEETALIASLEGERGMPRLKPPFPAQKGYWNLPTNINNVETYANVPWILREGGEKFAAMGTEKSPGTKVFALTGKIQKGGLVEVPMGMKISEIIYDIGGGIKDGKKFKAVQLGGPSGGCVPESKIDTPVDYENIAKIGAIVGSGGMVVMDETTCMVDMARFFLDFTRKESCGKCIHCRIGTTRMLEILERICAGKGEDGDIELLVELGENVKDGSLCGLGQTAPNPVLSTIRYFKNEYEDHIHNKKCTAHACKALIEFSVIEDKCIGCTVCAKNCPVDAIDGELKKTHHINQEICIKCGKCLEVCRFDAILKD